jgi:7-cyano-7-deazaguanine synthase
MSAAQPTRSTGNPQPCVVLLSGGLDSATTLAVAIRDGLEPHTLTFRYGQRHAIEIEAAARVAAHRGVRDHRVVDVDLGSIGGSALTADIPVPTDRSPAEVASGGIPATYVPARNTIFLAYATAVAEVLGAADLYIGVNAVDYSGYPDCRPEFIAAFERAANLGTRAGIEGERPLTIHAPLIRLSKAEIISLGVSLGVDYAMTVSCYDPRPDGRACGRCDSCAIRRRGFDEAGIPDATRYVR